MAKNANYYAKISGTWEQQYFSTTSTQVSYPNQGAGIFNGLTSVDAALDKVHSAFGAANGFATLDENSKIPVSNLPASVIGGMRLAGSLSFATSKTVDDVVGVANEVGEYVIVSAAGNWTQGTVATGTVLAPGDEGDYSFIDGIDLEAGDWIVVTAVDGQDYDFAIVNNTYRNAASNAYGITRLSDASAFASLSGSDVVTEGILDTVIKDNFAGTGTATTFARSDHSHTAYLQKSGGTMTGALTIGDGTSGDNLVINAVDEDNALGSNSNIIQWKYLPNGGSLTTVNLQVTQAGALQFAGNSLLDVNNWDSYVPEVFVSASTPSSGDGKNGDVWVEYSTI